MLFSVTSVALLFPVSFLFHVVLGDSLTPYVQSANSYNNKKMFYMGAFTFIYMDMFVILRYM